MKWRKLGRIYVPDGSLSWARSYAHLPTVDIINDEIIRVYFASLDENKYGRIGFVDLDINDPGKVLYIAPKPVLDIGELGTFDDCGAVPSCIITHDNSKYLYYIGFQRAERVPYMLFTGLAIENENEKKFKKYSQVPILDRTDDEPFSRSAPYIIQEDGIFKMWYWTCLKWTPTEKGVHYNNVIKYATSIDGINWKSLDHICIEPDFIDEFAVGRPSVIRDGDIYKMWYSMRSFNQPYTIGYAESRDEIHWERKDDEVGIKMSKTGWDSEMICYPCVVDIKGKRYMFYNGNRHGESGFGYAVLES